MINTRDEGRHNPIEDPFDDTVCVVCNATLPEYPEADTPAEQGYCSPECQAGLTDVSEQYFGDGEDGAYATPEEDGSWTAWVDCNSNHWTDTIATGLSRQEAIDTAMAWCFENGVSMEDDDDA